MHVADEQRWEDHEAMVTLEEITGVNIRAVLALEVSKAQQATYPRSNAYSIAEGSFPPDDDPVWMRAICEDGRPIGFIMTSEAADFGDYFLWRMMIDERFQGKGYGAAAINLLVNRIKKNGNPRVLLLSHQKDNLDAARFYEKLGFSYTGNNLDAGELEMELRFE